jgi:lipopolysaccharide transport system permease protein
MKPQTIITKNGQKFRFTDFNWELVFTFATRDIKSFYKQTLFGPLWYLFQPILTLVIYIFVFCKIARLGTDNVEPILFYFPAIVIWSFFTENFIKISSYYRDNSAIFSKVYFSRMVIPVSIIFTNLFKLFFQLLLLVCISYYYDKVLALNELVLLISSIFLAISLALGLGLIVNSLTVRFKDLIFLLGFGIQLLMYTTIVVYPIENVPNKLQYFVKGNPLTLMVASFREVFAQSGAMYFDMVTYNLSITAGILLIGMFLQFKGQSNFIDKI